MNETTLRNAPESRYLIIGIVASVVALLINPVIHAVAPIHFVTGLLVVILGPSMFGLVAIFAGARLYQYNQKQFATVLILSSIITTLAGIVYGTSLVF